jgi:predicted DNA-binding transcriptional regulator AlpA
MMGPPEPPEYLRRKAELPRSLPPKGLSRVHASQYLNVSPGKFDQMVADGRMPRPKVIDSRRVWDREAIDVAFEALPEAGAGPDVNPWDLPT